MASDDILRGIDSKIRRVPDFPKKGILFYDITTLLKEKEFFSDVVRVMINEVRNLEFDKVVSVESRGFIFGAPIAYELRKGFVIVRKEGKLPAETISYSYGLEYGTATVEMHTDAIQKGEKVIVVDDLLATGGTAEAVAKLVSSLGGTVSAFLFLIELEKLNGREKLESIAKVVSIIKY